MKTNLDIRVLELLCSRLCHDLISPVGAINNGVELIEEMGVAGDMASEAIGLIAHSADQAARRLRLFRLCYGAAGAESNVNDVHAAADAYFKGTRVTLDWHPDRSGGSALQRRGASKMALNLILLADEALPYGGTIAVNEKVAPNAVEISATGRQVQLRDDAKLALEGKVGADALTPRTVHAYTTGRFADYFAMTVEVRQDAAALGLRLVF